mmetsp:Transcript_82295/g.251500  ORF Transcript_82295/g.251500 Transcript_82295/m.251500 type:complete len:267 (+) Transcript_82295:1082-1882(+)
MNDMKLLWSPLKFSDSTQPLTTYNMSLMSKAQLSKTLSSRRRRPVVPMSRVSHHAPATCSCVMVSVAASASTCDTIWNLFADRAVPVRYSTASPQMLQMSSATVLRSLANLPTFDARTPGMTVARTAIRPPNTVVISTTKYSVIIHRRWSSSVLCFSPRFGFMKFIMKYTCQLRPNMIVFLLEFEMRNKKTTSATSKKQIISPKRAYWGSRYTMVPGWQSVALSCSNLRRTLSSHPGRNHCAYLLMLPAGSKIARAFRPPLSSAPV